MKARQNEESFEDFRSFMRDMSLEMAGGLEDPKFSQSVRNVEDNLMAPALKKLQEDITGVSALKTRLSEALLISSREHLQPSSLRET